MYGPARIAFVVAVDEKGIIGREQALPWRLPDDLRWFRQHTMGKPCIMGRKTYDSLPDRFRPLPGRQNIVITRQRDYEAPGAEVTHSIGEALSRARTSEEIIIVGGGEIFRDLMPYVDRLYLTLVKARVDGDVSFTGHQAGDWRETYRADHPADERHIYPFTWLILDRADANDAIALT